MDIMLDLETLGSSPGCAILSIGAVAFDTTTIHDSFTVHIDARSCQQARLSIDADTVLWWLRQDEDARRSIIEAPTEPLGIALARFSVWLAVQAKPIRLWSKGPSFDAAILAAAYRAIGLPVPWDFRDERCVRTALELSGVDGNRFREAGAVRHDAFADAMTQARAVQAASQIFGK